MDFGAAAIIVYVSMSERSYLRSLFLISLSFLSNLEVYIHTTKYSITVLRML